jgi:hypothetical protein
VVASSILRLAESVSWIQSLEDACVCVYRDEYMHVCLSACACLTKKKVGFSLRQ